MTGAMVGTAIASAGGTALPFRKARTSRCRRAEFAVQQRAVSLEMTKADQPTPSA
jgi:hypothetical protein